MMRPKKGRMMGTTQEMAKMTQAIKELLYSSNRHEDNELKKGKADDLALAGRKWDAMLGQSSAKTKEKENRMSNKRKQKQLDGTEM
jgi:hypothetical protein